MSGKGVACTATIANQMPEKVLVEFCKKKNNKAEKNISACGEGRVWNWPSQQCKHLQNRLVISFLAIPIFFI